MSGRRYSPADFVAQLRQRAEEKVEAPSVAEAEPSPTVHEMQRLVHELRVHRVELEMQNHDLVAAKEELERSRDRYQDLFELAPIGYLDLDGEGRIAEANWMASAMLGTPREQLSGQRLVHLVDPSDTDVVHRHLQQVRSTGQKFSCEASVTDTFGGTIVLRVDTAPVSAEGDDHYRSALIEVTERKRAEAQLREREVRLRAILETAIDAIVTFDGDGRIESANEAASLLFGCTPEELLGEPVETVVPGIHELPLGVHQEGFGRRRDGTTVPLDISMARQVSGKGLVTCVMRDLTEEKRTEEQLRLAQKTEIIGRLASGIAHDFNNVLMGVIASADRGLSSLAAEDPTRSFLEEIQQAASGGAAVVDQLLALTRKEGAQVKPMLLDSVVQRTENLLRSLVGDNARIELSLGADGRSIRAAKGQIEQVLANLIVNAQQAMPRGGTVRVTTGVQDPGSSGSSRAVEGEDDEWVVLTVSDSGEGMDEDTRVRAFEPFFTTREDEGGTGLGLSTVYGIVEHLSGRVELESERGTGTTCRIHLPLADVSPPAAVDSEPIVAGRGETVLIVEDDPYARAGIAQYLRHGGYEVIESGGANEALSCFDEEGDRIRLVLSDVVLPGLVSGVDLVKKLMQRSEPPNVMLMSAYPRSALFSQTSFLQHMTWLDKPFDEFTLLASVQEALGRSQGEVEGVGSGVRAAGVPQEVRGRATILLVSDQRRAQASLGRSLEQKGYRVVEAGDAKEALGIARRHGAKVDLVITDLSLPDGRGTVLASRLREARGDLPVVYVPGNDPRDDRELTRALEQPNTASLDSPLEPERVAEKVAHLLGPS